MQVFRFLSKLNFEKIQNKNSDRGSYCPPHFWLSSHHSPFSCRFCKAFEQFHRTFCRGDGSLHHGKAFPSRHSAMRRRRLCPLHPVTCREIPRRAYPLLGMTRRIEQHFSHVGTSPRRSLFAASSKPFRKRAILLSSEIAQRTGTCPRYIQQKNPSAGLGFLLLFGLT